MTRDGSVTALAIAALVACGGGGTGSTAPAATTPGDRPATVSLDDLEQALLEAQAWQVEARITANGAIAVDLTASVLATRDNRVRLHARGTFMGEPQDLRWVSDGMRTSDGAAAPPHATEAIVIGMTRMGVLHNVARLVGKAAPDHADGGARDWVVATDQRSTAPGELAFGVTVAGQPSGYARVWATPSPQGPVMTRRTITVHFEAGDMVVEETYAFDLAVELPSDAFAVGGGP